MYTPGKSTETIIHQVIGCIEKSLDMSGSILGTFLAMEGAFGNKTFPKISLSIRDTLTNSMDEIVR